MPGWISYKLESSLQGEMSTNPDMQINNLRYADDTTLRVDSKEELKSLLMRVKKLA